MWLNVKSRKVFPYWYMTTRTFSIAVMFVDLLFSINIEIFTNKLQSTRLLSNRSKMSSFFMNGLWVWKMWVALFFIWCVSSVFCQLKDFYFFVFPRIKFRKNITFTILSFKLNMIDLPLNIFIFPGKETLLSGNDVPSCYLDL